MKNIGAIICSIFLMSIAHFAFAQNTNEPMNSSIKKAKIEGAIINNDSAKVAPKLQNSVDSIKVKSQAITAVSYPSGDTTSLYYKFNSKTPVPKRSGLYSAVLPGLGQAYNKQYWKIGLVYGGFAYAAWRIDTTLREYNNYREALVQRLDNNPSTVDPYDAIYSTSALSELRTKTRQRMDKLVVYSVVWYGVGIIDAITAAHLKNFDISKDISIKIAPMYNTQYFGIATVWQRK